MFICEEQDRARKVVAALVLATSILLAGCRGPDPEADAKVEKLLAAGDPFSVPAPAEYPPGIPTFPGLRGVMTTTWPMASTLQAVSKESVKTLSRHYKQAFEDAGWTYDEALSMPGDDYYAYQSPTGTVVAAFGVAPFERRGVSISMLTITEFFEEQ